MRLVVASVKVMHKYCRVSEYVLFLTSNTLFIWLQLHSFFKHLTTMCCDTHNEPMYARVYKPKFLYVEPNTEDPKIRNLLRDVSNILRIGWGQSYVPETW
jgi:hypothetical protein